MPQNAPVTKRLQTGAFGSPVRARRSHAIEQDHVQEIDYLIGDDAYKRAWMSLRRERWGIVAYDPRSASGLIGLGREIAGRILKHLKSRRRPIDVVA